MLRHWILGFITYLVYTSIVYEASHVVITSEGENLVPRLGEYASGICQHFQTMGGKQRQCKVLPGRQNLAIMHAKDTFS